MGHMKRKRSRAQLASVAVLAVLLGTVVLGHASELGHYAPALPRIRDFFDQHPASTSARRCYWRHLEKRKRRQRSGYRCPRRNYDRRHEKTGPAEARATSPAELGRSGVSQVRSGSEYV